MKQNDKLEIKFYAGTNTIGGTIISLTYKGERIVFDFGTEYKPTEEVFKKLENIDDDNALETYLDTELLPKIDGIYKKSDLHTTILISHLHLDHFGGIGLIDPEIDVYMSEKSLALYNALSKVGKTDSYGVRTDFKSFEGTMQIGDFKITILPIDHDCYGSSGFIFEVAGKKIVYSGDVRFHGIGNETMEFIGATKDADILIVEGVTNSFKDDDYTIVPSLEISGCNEEEIPAKFAKYLSTDRVVAFDFYRANVNRLKAISDITKGCGRELILNEMNSAVAEGTLGLVTRQLSEIESFNDNSLLINLDYRQFDKYLDCLPSGSVYIHSNSEPLGDFDSRWNDFTEKLESKGIELVTIHSSGHGETENIQYFINEVNPKLLIPIHSLKPYLASVPNKRLLPEIGVVYDVAELLE